MQIVIDIPLGLKMDFEKENWTALLCAEMKLALQRGTPLPKENTLEEWKKDFISFIDELDMPKDDYNGIIEYINEIPTIIKADKGDKNEDNSL